MKKLIAVFAVLAASSLAQAQNLGNHPDARNDRVPTAQGAEQGSRAYRRAEHRRMKHHRKHRRHHRG